MKKKYYLVIFLIILAIPSIIYARYHYREILFYVLPDTKLSDDEIRLPVLVYHHFSEEEKNENPLIVGRANFRRQIKFLKENGYHPILVKELADFVEKGTDLPAKPVLITMDDGYESNYTIAYEVLKEFDTKANIFMIGHAVGSQTYKETGLPLSPYLSLEQGKEMIASGLVSIQSHSMDMHQVADYESYRNNSQIRISATKKDFDTEEGYIRAFREDIAQSKRQITGDFGEEWIAYSYPLGHYDDLTENLVTESGIKITLSVDHGSNIIQKNNRQTLRLLKRSLVTDDTTNQGLYYILEERAVPK